MAQTRALVLAAALACVLAATASAATGDPKQRHTPAGELAAGKVLVRTADLGKGWKATPQAASTSASVCKGLRPNLSDLVEAGYAQSPLFTLGQLATVTQSVRVFATKAQTGTAWLRTDSLGLVLCLEKQLKAATFKNATVLPAGQFRLDFGKLTQHTDGFRVVAAVSPKDDPPFKVYADVLLLSRGRTLTTVTFLGFLQPVNDALERRIARTLAARLGAKSSLVG